MAEETQASQYIQASDNSVGGSIDGLLIIGGHNAVRFTLARVLTNFYSFGIPT